MKTELSDREYEVMKRFQKGRVHVGGDEETLNSLKERELMELHHQTWRGKTISYYVLSFQGLKVFEGERNKRNGLYQLLKSIFS